MQFFEQLKIKLFNKYIGSDEFGNSYYQGGRKRYVVYKGMPEPSKVPPEWFVWLHYSTNTTPVNIDTKRHSWQKIHLPNLTGTKNAYFPNSNKTNATKERKPYISWTPNN